MSAIRECNLHSDDVLAAENLGSMVVQIQRGDSAPVCVLNDTTSHIHIISFPTCTTFQEMLV